MILFACCFVQLFTTVPKYFRDNLSLSESYIGLIMAINGIIIVAFEMILIYTLEKRNRNIYYIIIGLIMCALAYLSLLIPGNTKLISLIMILFITVGEIMAMPFMNSFWISRTNENNRGQYAALYTITWGIGNTIGPLLCSALVEVGNFKIMFLAVGFILTAVSYGFYKLSKHN